jgi:hypothetical protein
LLCAVAGALSNLLTGLAGSSLAWLLGLRFITGFLLADSLSLMQWIAAMVPPQYLLVLLAAGPAAGLVCMKSLVGDNRITPPSDAQTG